MFAQISTQYLFDWASCISRHLGLVSLILAANLLFLDSAEAQSNQIQSDQTLGVESSVIKPNVDINGLSSDVIEGGASRGENLFHSFTEFNVGEGNRVYFNNPSQIQRIFSRVTGGHQSSILGTLGVLGNADLFLLNPSGIIFGPNAALDLKGSFIATTASDLIFSDGTQFSAVNTETSPLLTVSIPVGLQFRNTPSAIVNQSQTLYDTEKGFIDIGGLRVQPLKTLALIGGDVILKGGFLNADGGRVEVGSVAESGQVSIKPIAKGWMLSYDGVQNFGDIRLQQDVFQLEPVFQIYSQINANGSNRVQEGGDIQLQGRHIILADGSRIFAAANAQNKPGGTLTVNASESVEIVGNLLLGLPAILSTSIINEGNGGNLEINTKQVILRDLAFITSQSIPETTGKVGNVTINASESVNVSNKSEISTLAQGAGDAGILQINTRQLTIKEQGQISAATFAQGNGGRIVVNAEKVNIHDGGSIFVNSQGTGQAGNININASSIGLSNFGSLNAETQAGEGNITLNIQDETIIRNNSKITTNSTGNESGGNIIINTGVLAAFENSDITANSVNATGGQVIINTQGIFQILNSDITATSALGPEFNGIIELNTPEIDPSRGLVSFPETVIDPTALVVQNPCKKDKANGFTIAGRGGLPPNINDDFNRDAVQVDLVEPVSPQNRPKKSEQTLTLPQPIKPVQGWIFNNKGEVVLTAYNPIVTEPQRDKEKSVSCPAL
ncbi:filamentous hemagglutinin N-terminal domain-containing protein [Chroococcus sp. FPU101]|uniref:two-partner secretion domain-containing protein n=1 Tax=Chroococcus sp. FPU101 TaxID=1974212 RepID=UPI001A8DA097|nr:filamentous hemagglutinin N-terminal domain-containing protein [Chroococcus sp. FPU101]GFE69522.1 Filamentous haemagglutinin-like [Chroococcus sp. FPU101]